MGKKPHGTMADQLKAAADKMAQDKAAREEAEKKAQVRIRQEEAARRTAREEAISDEERFERAVSGIARADAVKKFDDDVPGRKAPPPAAPVRKRTDDELFLDAMFSGGEPPRK